jgi:hypothetical protein
MRGEPGRPTSPSTRTEGHETNVATPEPVVDASALLRRLAGKAAEDVLSKISNGDPLRLHALCASRIRETFFLLDPDRVLEKALSVVALGVQQEPERCGDPG